MLLNDLLCGTNEAKFEDLPYEEHPVSSESPSVFG